MPAPTPAPTPARLHICGHGPVELTVSYEAPNDCGVKIPWGRALQPGGTYQAYEPPPGGLVARVASLAIYCPPTVTKQRRERWSDWPECGGAFVEAVETDRECRCEE